MKFVAIVSIVSNLRFRKKKYLSLSQINFHTEKESYNFQMNLLKFFYFTELNVIDCFFQSSFTSGVSILRHLQAIHYPNIVAEQNEARRFFYMNNSMQKKRFALFCLVHYLCVVLFGDGSIQRFYVHRVKCKCENATKL